MICTVAWGDTWLDFLERIYPKPQSEAPYPKIKKKKAQASNWECDRDRGNIGESFDPLILSWSDKPSWGRMCSLMVWIVICLKICRKLASQFIHRCVVPKLKNLCILEVSIYNRVEPGRSLWWDYRRSFQTFDCLKAGVSRMMIFKQLHILSIWRALKGCYR